MKLICLLQGIWSASLISTFILRFTEHLQFYFSFTIKLQKKSKLGGRNKKTLKISNILFYNQAHSQRNWFITRRLTVKRSVFFMSTSPFLYCHAILFIQSVHLPFSCLKSNFGTLSRGHPHSPDVNHCPLLLQIWLKGYLKACRDIASQDQSRT